MKKLLILSIFLIILVACGTSEEESQGQIDDVVNLALEEATTSTSTTSTTSTSTTTMPVSVVEVMPNIEIACKPIKNQDGYLFFNIKITRGTEDIEVVNIVSWFDSTRTDNLFISEDMPESEGLSSQLSYKVDDSFSKYEIEVLIMDNDDNFATDYCLYDRKSLTTPSTTTTSTTTTIPQGLEASFSTFAGEDINNEPQQWYPSLKDKCVKGENLSPNFERITMELSKGNGRELQLEPGIIFWDETFTMFYRRDNGASGGILPIGNTSLGPFEYDLQNKTGFHVLHDDGTNGDLLADDGVYTNTCLGLPDYIIQGTINDDPDPMYKNLGDMGFLNPIYRGSVGTEYLTSDVRINDIGFFINTGDWYFDSKFTTGRGVQNCYPCKVLWELGAEFDFISYISRESTGGWGYSRVHDNFTGMCLHEGKGNINKRPYLPEYLISDNPHTEWIGVVHNNYLNPSGFTHELMHGLAGMGCTTFPGNNISKELTLNYGDRMHLKAETTINSSLSGPFWDPSKGWPYSVRVKNEEGIYREAFLTRDNNGNYILKAESDPIARIESDIMLYQFGLLNASQVTDTYYSIAVSDISIDECFTIPEHIGNVIYGDYQDLGLFCDSTIVNTGREVSFNIDDFINFFGEWGIVGSPNYNPEKIRVGMAYISDRAHTEAEITWHTLAFRKYQQSNESTKIFGNSTTTWLQATRGLSELIMDPNLLIDYLLIDLNNQSSP
jgi:hypothetical protein